MDLRGPIYGLSGYPTIVMFAEGRGIATARALIESGAEECGLNLPMRKDVRLYYRVRTEGIAALLAYITLVSGM